MTMEGGFYNRKRRVATVYGSVENEFRLLYNWDKNNDQFEKVNLDQYLKYISEKKNMTLNQIKNDIENYSSVLKKLKEKDVCELSAVREYILEEIYSDY